MMAGVRSWLLAVIAVSLLCALADSLMPRGPVRGAGRLVCGLVLLAAIVSPLVGLDAAAGRAWLEDCLADRDLLTEELQTAVDSQMEAVIAGKYAAYIVDKAAQMGVDAAARVECRAEDGLYLPDRVTVAGGLAPGQREALARMIARDLGVPAERQNYIDEEEVP